MATALLLLITEFFMVLFLVLGYMARFRGRTDILASYRREKVRDPEGLARYVGTNLLVLGMCALVTLMGLFVFPENEVLIFLVFTAGIVPVVSVITAIGSRKYVK